MTTQQCNTCQELKMFAEFAIRDKETGKLHNRCKACTNLYAKSYRKTNADLIKLKQQSWYSEKGRDWKQANDKERRHITRKKDKERYQNDEAFRMSKVLRTRFKKVFKGARVCGSMISYIGAPMDYFLKWIQFQFKNGMSWESYGLQWDIDHVQPCNSFNLLNDCDKHKCFNWTNMRPLSKSENNSKSDKILPDVIASHHLIVLSFKSLYPVPSFTGNCKMAQSSELRDGNKPADKQNMATYSAIG